jgi:hypothetical protein
MLNVKGLNDIQSVSNFANSASSLGLLGENGQDSKKLQTFLNTASGAGALVAGKVDIEAVSNTVNILQGSGILPATLHQPTQVLTLLNSAKNLGINSTNIAQKVSAALDIAKKAGIKLGTLKKPSSNQQEKQGPPPEAGKAITWEKLYFAPYNFKDILELDITQDINKHACLHIRGTLTDPPKGQESQDYVQLTEQYTPVALSYTDPKGAKKFLFQGVVTSIQQHTTGELKYLDIEARSFSYLMDIKKCSRSFQRHQEPYSYIFDRINDSARQYIPDLTGDALAAQDTEASQTTEKLIIQYQETDWTFLKRMASHFNIGLTPDVTLNTAKIYFGLSPKPQEEQKSDQTESGQDDQSDGSKKEESAGPELCVSTYKIRRDTANYSISTNNNRKNSQQNFSENDFTYCEAQSLDILQLGQPVTFLNLTWYIRAIHTIMVKGAINNIYTLTTQQGLMQDDLFNTKLAGISLPGVVKEVVNDQVRVHITQIDQEWDDGATWFFPYTTIYSSPDGSGWYCMPEIGDSVRVYFSNNMEEAGVAASSVNLTPSKRGSRSDPDTKIISTVYGKQIILTPGGIQIIANGNLLMTLSDDGGLTINSDKKIVLSADDDILISSQSQLTVNGKSGVSLSQGGGSINITADVNIGGNQVKIQP